MSASIVDVFLWLTVLWPLLLAIPGVCIRLPWSCHLAILPALILALFATHDSVTIPWVLFGTGFMIDGNTRWILAMSVSVWLVAATMVKRSKHPLSSGPLPTLFLLTMAGNFGVVLAADLITFFSFSTLMGYGFYGMLIQGGDKRVYRAGRLYLTFLVVADLALFEALLLAASTTTNLQFEVVKSAMSEASSAQFYLGMVLIAFVLKTGIWPLSLWLSASFQALPRSKLLLLGAVPVAMGLLGMLRWLPLEESSFYAWGMVTQMLGIAAMLYAVFRFLNHMSVNLIPISAAMLGTGLFFLATGLGLSHPSMWGHYGSLAYLYIATFGGLLAIITSRIQSRQTIDVNQLDQFDAFSLRADEWFGLIRCWARTRMIEIEHLQQVPRKVVSKYFCASFWQDMETNMTGWSVRITMAVLLGLLLAWLAM